MEPIGKPNHKRHSILGSISLIAGIVCIVISCVALVGFLALILVHLGSAGPSDLQSTLGELVALGNGALSLGGLGAGVGGFFERDRDRVPNILGIILCVLSLLALAILVLLSGIGAGRNVQPNL